MNKTIKILQEICFLLSLNNGRMNLIKLIKELYLADRLSIEEREFSISGDIFYSMKNGPILSNALDLLTNDLPDFIEYIHSEVAQDPEERYYPDIVLVKTPGQDRLSKNDKKYLQQVSEEIKKKKAFYLVDLTHKLPEWQEVLSGRKKIHFSDILRALGKNDKEILEIKASNDTMKRFNMALSGVFRE